MKGNYIFDVESLANKLKIENKVLDKLIKEAKDEFPDDDMLMELHVVRALKQSCKEKLN